MKKKLLCRDWAEGCQGTAYRDGYCAVCILSVEARKEGERERRLRKRAQEVKRQRYSWKLLEDVESNSYPFNPDIVEFLRPGESYVDGEVMKQRAKELNANLGQRDLEYLEDHQELIPKEWRNEYYLVAPGTVRRDCLGLQCVPCLTWLGNRWFFEFTNLESRWGGRVRLVTIHK